MLKKLRTMLHPKQTDEARHLRLGQEGEDAAAHFLQEQGYVILARNWRQGRLELDIVCRHADELVFVEVKTRSSRRYGGPLAGISPAKARTLCRAAQAWLSSHSAWEKPCRFEIVCLVRQGGKFSVEHYRHAFDLCLSLDSGHAPWQPW